VIIDSENDYIGALKGNQSGLLKAVRACFKPKQSNKKMNKGHGRIEKRTVRISHDLKGIPKFPGLKTLIRVESERQVYRANIRECEFQNMAQAQRQAGFSFNTLKDLFGMK
jgi:hypothetical protein